MFEPIFGKGSTVVYTKIILQNLSRPLDLRKMFWPKLKHLEHWDPFNFERLLTLMLHAPNLESLKLPLLTINGYYDKKYLKRNLHALVSAMCKLLTHPLKKLEMNYFKTGSDSTCYAFAIKFVIHVFKQLKELKVNDTYSDIVKDIVFRALGKKFRHLKINGDTWDEYFATNIR
ncbi:hypothetical protein LPJ73_002432 [Coemansia sp. RSA 2703]|nr:hypothetical protein LPJ73_002432 [Coemansia sp. RSA 2703]KAJ2374774.1 hypothetical protein IW150_002916 [Coemansia sp. RSA 2607]